MRDEALALPLRIVAVITPASTAHTTSTRQWPQRAPPRGKGSSLLLRNSSSRQPTTRGQRNTGRTAGSRC